MGGVCGGDSKSKRGIGTLAFALRWERTQLRNARHFIASAGGCKDVEVPRKMADFRECGHPLSIP
jgi:hypothetical protein